jgi:spermidine synthase
MNPGTLKLFLYTMFFLSGASGLMYEVVWLRMLERMMGVTIYAASTVLAAFMAGLALGSFVFGRLVDRRRDALRVYGILELGIAAAVLLVPLLLSVFLPLYRLIHQTSADGTTMVAATRAFVCFTVLLIPTTMMGGTLPVLTSYLVKKESVFGRNFSLLYGLNTLGAFVGVALTGFVTLGALGERRTLLIGALVNLAVGLSALFLYSKERRRREAAKDKARAARPEDTPISPYSDGIRTFVLVAFAASGLTALAYEIVWMRQLIIFLRTSIYAFSGMLAVFLLGIAAGSILMNRVVDRLKAPLAAFALLEAVVCLLSLVNLYLFAPLDSGFMHRVFGLASAVYAAVIIVLPLTLTFGMITPIAGRCYAKSVGRSGSAVGWFYAANTVGGIVGSLLAGFWLIPTLGSTTTVLLLAILNLLLAVVLLVLEPNRSVRRKVVWVPLVVLLVLLVLDRRGADPFLAAIERRIVDRVGTTWIPPQYAALPPSHEIHFHKEGIEGTVTAFEVNHWKQLWVNGMGMTSLGPETKLMAHLPLLFTADPRDLLVVCFGMGTTIRSAARHPDLAVTTVELVPEAFETFDFYHADGAEILASDKVQAVVDDGRNYLLLTDARYDVITVDPPPPIWSARTVNLYSREFFALCRARLKPGGVMCLWLPGGTEIEVRSMARTFSSVFPRTVVWSGPRRWGYYFIGSDLPFDWGRFQRKARLMFQNPVIVRDLTEYDERCATLEQLNALFLWDEQEVRELGEGGVMITDDYPFTEFPLWRYLFHGRQQWRPHSDPSVGRSPLPGSDPAPGPG